MRTTILIAASLLLVCAAGWAEPPSPSPADRAFLQALANPQEALPGVGTPAPQFKTCSASTDCGDGNTAACTGNSICQVTIAGVKCDGVETKCPNYCSIGMSCQCCNGPYTMFCFSRQGNCQYTSGGISCNGSEITCENSCPDCPNW
ncbi:MAG TPA: hypothetical protein VGX68_04915 [Thermoanaerobaculia bacterium]|jgi:hypothetical protein|nr:hypothetical protein [Thermoanaerobaculia bacterium]